MKIVFLTKRFSEGGELMHMFDLSSELVKLGNEVFILTGGVSVIFANNQRMQKIHQQFTSNGVNIIYMPFPDSTMNVIKYLYFLLKGTFYSYLFLKKNKIDVIHVHRPIMSVIPKFLNLKFVSTVHNMNLEKVFWNFKPTYQIAISEGTYKEVVDQFHFKPNEISIINNGVSSKFSQLATSETKKEIKKALEIDNKDIIIGFVGRITYEKGVDVLLKAIQIMKKQLDCSFKLVLLGGFENSQSYIENVIKETDTLENVLIYDFQDPKKFYDIFDVFVLPSRSEGFPLTVIEAMVSGCCVVRTDTGGAFEQIINEESGFIFRNGNEGELADILVKLLKLPEYRKEIAMEGRERALRKFTSDKMAVETLKVYDNVKLNWN